MNSKCAHHGDRVLGRPNVCSRWTLVFALLCSYLIAYDVAVAQQELDLEPSDVPVWEALERYRDDPLCLRSIQARELTVLPGISLRTAHRIVNIVAMRPDFSFESLADSACLTVEQMLILASCTTLDCRARPFIRSAWARVRDRDGTRSARTDVVSESGRVGSVIDSATFSGWLSASLHNTTLHVGAMRAGAGMGLLLGGSGRFGSTISARSGSTPEAPSIRAHTSSYLDGSFRGIALHHATLPWTAVAGFSSKDDERAEQAMYVAVQRSFEPAETTSIVGTGPLIKKFSTGIAALSLAYNALSDSKAASVIRDVSHFSISAFSTLELSNFDVRTEIAIDNAWASAATLVMHRVLHKQKPRWSCGLRHFSADYRAPYASSISDASYISNEYGGFIAADLRTLDWLFTTSLDIHGSLAPRFGSPLPTRGFDMQVSAVSRQIISSANYLSGAPNLNGRVARGSFVERCTLDLRARYECDTEGWRPPDEAFTRMHTRSRISLRVEGGLQVVRSVHVRARIDVRTALYSAVQSTNLESSHASARPSVHGWATFVDAHWQAMQWIAMRARITVFNTESIDVAPYFVETDALGAARTVACSGQGSRLHLAVRVNPVSFATVSGSVSLTTLSRSVMQQPSSSVLPHPLMALVQLDLRLPLKP